MEKPKLTKEQAFSFYNRARVCDFTLFERELIDAGYMERPETAFERAEKLASDWISTNKLSFDDEIKVCRIIDAYREAIAEMAKAKEAAK